MLGRDREVATVCKALGEGESRLITLTGPPGVGKTRLALEVAARVAPRFPDGLYFISLAPVSDSDLVLPGIGHALGIQERSDASFDEQIQGFLRPRRAVLVLDNFEHVQGAAPLVASVLGGAPELRILVTSRGPLRISGELEFMVAPLPVPDLNDLPPLAQLAENPAVALFEARAAAANPNSRSGRRTRRWWPSSASGSTAYPWPSSSRPHARSSSAPRRCWNASRTGSLS